MTKLEAEIARLQGELVVREEKLARAESMLGMNYEIPNQFPCAVMCVRWVAGTVPIH